VGKRLARHCYYFLIDEYTRALSVINFLSFSPTLAGSLQVYTTIQTRTRRVPTITIITRPNPLDRIVHRCRTVERLELQPMRGTSIRMDRAAAHRAATRWRAAHRVDPPGDLTTIRTIRRRNRNRINILNRSHFFLSSSLTNKLTFVRNSPLF